MKNSKQTYRLLTLCFLLFGTSLFLSNCDNSENLELEQITSSKLSATLLKGEKLLEENNIVSEQIKKLTGEIKLGRGIDVPEYGFSIDTTSVLKLVGDNFESFTFQIFRDNPEQGVLENYVLTTYSDSTFTQFTAKYNELAEGVYDAKNPLVTPIIDGNLLLLETCNTEEIVTSEWEEDESNCFYFPCQDVDAHGYGDNSCPHAQEGTIYQAIRVCSGSWVTSSTCGGGPGSDNSSNYNDPGNSNTGTTTGATGVSGDSTGTTTTTTATTAHTSHSIFNDLNFVNFVNDYLSLEEEEWVRRIDNYRFALRVSTFLYEENYIDEAKILARELLIVIKNDSLWDITPYINNVNTIPSGVSFQDYDPNDPILGNQILLDIVNGAIDGFGNLILIYLEFKSHSANEGKVLRLLMPKMGLEVPDDIPDETLGDLFSLRKRNRKLVVEYQDNTLKGLVIDVATSAFDMLALISPSRGGGAYLLASGGQRVTYHSLSNILESLKNSVYVLRGPMIGKRIGHTYKKHGSHLTEFSKMRALNGNTNIGQWLDDAAAESFIARHLDQLINGPIDIPIPNSINDIGTIYRTGDAVPFSPTHIRLIPSGSGVKTAYPINSTLDALGNIGTYIP